MILAVLFLEQVNFRRFIFAAHKNLSSGGSTSAADAVVDEIIAAGGSAKPNYASVEHASEIVEPVMEEFGKLDILINNAGILRDKNMLRISQQ
jgi:NAD(P)-dependent dehydrogenase (short-subunit alcohol dehydrogenase family)